MPAALAAPRKISSLRSIVNLRNFPGILSSFVLALFMASSSVQHTTKTRQPDHPTFGQCLSVAFFISRCERFTIAKHHFYRYEKENWKGKKNRASHDTHLLPRKTQTQWRPMPWMRIIGTVRLPKTRTLQVWRKQNNLQEVSHPLLSPSDERTNVQSDALGWS